jgi:hypothetical protein
MAVSDMTKTAASAAVRAVDPSWRGLYLAGGILALACLVLSIVVPALMYLPVAYPRTASGAELLTFIGEHRLRWMVLQTLTLGPGFLAVQA